MGRVSRHKKIKAIDPFSKTGGFVDVDKGKVFNVAPRARDVDAVPKGVAKLIAAQSFAARSAVGGAVIVGIRGGGAVHSKPPAGAAAVGSGAKAPVGRGVPAAPPPVAPLPSRRFDHIRSLPGETQASFNHRINVERRKRQLEVAAAAPIGRKLGDKRAQFLEARRLKRERGRRGRSAGEDDEGGAGGAGGDGSGRPAKRARPGAGPDDDDDAKAMDFPTDSVAFGERAMEPPRLTVAPRQSQKQKQALAAAHDARKAVRAAQVAGASAAQRSAADAAAALLAQQRAADVQRAQMAAYKDEVAAAYQRMKAARVEGRIAGAGAAAGGKRRRDERAEPPPAPLGGTHWDHRRAEQR